MKRRAIILIVLIFLLPLAALVWAVLRIAESEQVLVQQRFRDLMEDRLNDVNANIVVSFDNLGRELSELAAIDDFQVETLRRINRREPRLLQLFVLDPRGQLVYPNPTTELNSNERVFLIQASKMFTGQDLKDAVMRSEQGNDQLRVKGSVADSSRQLSRAADLESPIQLSDNGQIAEGQTEEDQSRVGEVELQTDMVQQAYQAMPIRNLEVFAESSGWFVWYWDRGLNLIYWQRRPSGHIVGCALERARWMADLVAQLPDTVSTPGRSDNTKLQNLATRVRLLNASGDSVYQWGAYEPTDDARSICEIPVAEPLAAWRLQCFVPFGQLTAGTGRSVYLSLLTGLLGVAAALAVIAWLLVREYARDMHAAAQQVSFVNQVSHELKTPLTNIRMYAELLERDLEQFEAAPDLDADELERPRQRLGVILSEGQRLSRLIGNVLTFARHQKKTLRIQPQEVVPDDLLMQVVDRFRPALADLRIEIETHLHADETMSIDPDILEQILGNLISNVEKYAVCGRWLCLESRIEAECLVIDVRDEGPGIEPEMADKVFNAFSRGSNAVNHAAGTGIGLTIARELARLHGGDVQLLDAESGCHFQVVIAGQPAGPEMEAR